MAIRIGTNGNDTLLGTNGKDTLNGLDGDAILDGGANADIMNGGNGDDTYIVDNVSDVAFEKADEGIDSVISSVSYTLTANVENLTLTGTASNRATGNALNNIITGNSGANSLSGGAGNDTLYGGAGIDFLDGGTGADTLSGGTDSDLYIVDNLLDVVIENANEGALDIIQSSVSYALPSNVESLLLTGINAVDGTGNAQNNTLIGNNASNTLNGLGGSDVLYGAGGEDTLVYRLAENDNALDTYGGGTGIDTLRLNFTASEWSNPAIQSEVARYHQYLKTITGEVSDLTLFNFDFGNLTKLVISGTEKLDVQVNGSTIDYRAPAITSAIASGAITQNPLSVGTTKLSASGELSFSDLDYNGTHNVASPVRLVTSQLPEGNRGTLTASVVNDTIGVGDITGKVTWTYEIDNAAVQYLGADKTATEIFDVVIIDDTGKAVTQQVTVTVTGINDAPVSANDVGYKVNEDGTLTVVAALGVLANDADPDSDALTAVIHTAPAHGTVALASNGSFLYTPDANFFGSDSFTYKASDGSLDSVPSTVTIDVSSVNDAPVATDKMISSVKTTAHVFKLSDFGFFDTDQNNLLNVKIDGLPQFGKLTDAGVNVSVGNFVSATDIAAGKLIFTPSQLVSGIDNKIIFQVQDDGGTANGGLDTSSVPNVFNVNTIQNFVVYQELRFPDSLSGKAPVIISPQTDSLAGFLNFFSENYAFTGDSVIDLFIPVTGDPYTFQVLPNGPAATGYKLASMSEILDDTIPTLAPPLGSSISSSGQFSWKPTISDIGKDYYFNVQTIRDDGIDLFDFTPLDLINSVAIRAHAYKPIDPVTPETKIVFVPYDGAADEPVPNTNSSISISNFTVNSSLTGTAPFSNNPNQTIPINLIESSIIIVVPPSQIDSMLLSVNPDYSVFVTEPVIAFPIGSTFSKVLHTDFTNLLQSKVTGWHIGTQAVGRRI